jgi:predicted ribosomally synthesized peptide with nif11-like leader
MNKNVVAFLQKSNQDTTLGRSLIGISLDELVALAEKNGFPFTGEDWMNALTELHSEELSDSQLGNVAGGTTPLNFQPVSSQYQIPGVLSATGIPNFAPGTVGK